MKPKTIYSKLWLAFFCAATICLHAVAANPPGIAWFQEARLGLFIHWGLYSEAGGVWNGKPSRGGEHFMLYERIPLKEYAKLADRFNPTAFDAEQWVKTAKRAGMKYLVITTKHHEGFAMFDSPCSNYDIVDCTPFGRDPIKELADACYKEGILLGCYYSLGRDLESPNVPPIGHKRRGTIQTKTGKIWQLTWNTKWSPNCVNCSHNIFLPHHAVLLPCLRHVNVARPFHPVPSINLSAKGT